jgi:16S rRNA (cytidine1402-2'-O)-methyltransferase
VLAAAAVVAAEDTRTSARILHLAGSSPARQSHRAQRSAAHPELLEAAKTAPIALVSDAGTPVVADPGARLVAAAHDAGVPVFAIAGPSALTAALSVSGFEGSDVHFLGFLPRQRSERLTRLRTAMSTAAVIAFFESPNRLPTTLTELASLGDPTVTVCRELTKLHEQVVRGPASSLAGRFSDTRGECTLVVQSPPRPDATDKDVRAYLAEMHRAGARRSPAAAEAARRFGIERQRAYMLWPDGPA